MDEFKTPHFRKYLVKNLPPTYLPNVFLQTEYAIDWNIFGPEISKVFCMIEPTNDYLLRYSVDFKSWYKTKTEVKIALRWAQDTVFDVLLNNKMESDKVLLTITKNMVKKIKLPIELETVLLEHLYACYHARHAVYSNYYYQECLKIPF